MNINMVCLIGNLTRDVELRYTQNNIARARVNIAINNGKDKDGNDRKPYYHHLVVWGKQAEIFAKYLHKGSKVAIEGVLVQEIYETEKGDKRESIYVNVNQFQFLDSKPKDNHEPEVPDYLNQTPEEAVASVVNSPDPFEEMGKKVASDNELPF